MVKCEECGKTLEFFEGYKHPTMGKKHYLCSTCFDLVNESVTKWREFVVTNSFKTKASKRLFKLNWKKIILDHTKLHN